MQWWYDSVLSFALAYGLFLFRKYGRVLHIHISAWPDCLNKIFPPLSSFRIQVEAKVTSREDLRNLELSETRILLLYSTKPEARQIMEWAKEAGLTGDSYVWVTTQSVIGESKEASSDFPAGMLGRLFPTFE